MNKILLLSIILAFANMSAKAQCAINSTPYNNCSWGDQIDALTINGISSTNSSGCSSNGYGGPFTSSWLFAPGGSYSLSITCGNGVYNQGIGIWMDLNNNGSYENSEMVWASSNISQSHSGTFTIPTTAAGGTTRMRVRCAYSSTVSNGQACTAGIGYGYGETEDYIIDICSAPTITAQPQNSFACEDGEGNIVVKAQNATGHQWQMNNGIGWSNLTNNANFENVGGDTLKLKKVSATLNGSAFRCIVSNCGGSAKDTSAEAFLDVYKNTEITSQSILDTTCETVDIRLEVKHDGNITGYVWKQLNTLNQNYEPVTGPNFVVNGNKLNIINPDKTFDKSKYICVVNGICGSDESAPMELKVDPLPEVLTPPNDENLKQGATAHFTVGTAGVNLRYQWQVASTNDTFVNINEGGIYFGARSKTLQVRGVSRVQDGFKFRCVVSGTGNCALGKDSSNFAVLYVEPAVSVSNVTNTELLNLYPNPTSGNQIIIKAGTNNSFSGAQYTIADNMGRIIATGNLSTNQTSTINVSDFASGLYIVNISSKDQSKYQILKFTKL